MPTRYIFRDHVANRLPLAINGEVVVPAGPPGEVVKVVRDAPSRQAYHVYFQGRVFQVPESALNDVAEVPD